MNEGTGVARLLRGTRSFLNVSYDLFDIDVVLFPESLGRCFDGFPQQIIGRFATPTRKFVQLGGGSKSIECRAVLHLIEKGLELRVILIDGSDLSEI